MSDLVKDNVVNLRATLTQHGEVYQGPGEPFTPEKKPAGRYVCMECGDAQITFHTPQDEYKTKCPKCNSYMTRVNRPLSI